MLLVISLQASAVTWKGPEISCDPATIPPNGTVDIVFSVHSGTSPRQNPNPQTTPATTYADAPDFLFYNVHQVQVFTPLGPNHAAYMLGSAAAPGIAGPDGNNPLDGMEFRVFDGDELRIPFGPGAGNIMLTNGQSEVFGPYYWWKLGTGGGRIDSIPGLSPTADPGLYAADGEGRLWAGNSYPTDVRVVLFFDIPGFFVQVPEIAVATVFPVSLAFAFLALKRRSFTKKSHQ